MPSRPQMMPPVGKSGPGTISSSSCSVHVRVVDHLDDRVADFAQVVRQQIARHADGDAGRAVDQQVGELAGQDGRLHAAARRSWAGSRPCRVRGRPAVPCATAVMRASVYRMAAGGSPSVRAEVSLRRRSADSAGSSPGPGGRASGRRPLRRAGDSCRWCRRRSSRTCRCLRAGPQVQVVHRDQDAALRRLEPVADIGQRPVHDGAHRVGEVAVLKLLLDLEVFDPIGRRGRLSHYPSLEHAEGRPSARFHQRPSAGEGMGRGGMPVGPPCKPSVPAMRVKL